VLRHFSVHRISLIAAGALFLCAFVHSAENKTVWIEQEKPIVDQITTLRKLDDKVRVQTTKDLALRPDERCLGRNVFEVE
jgi:hypothetical protein